MRFDMLGWMMVVGGCIWALRALPMRVDMARLRGNGALARFVAATGVAAIATLFAAAILPEVAAGRALPAVIGAGAVVAVYWPSDSVVAATLAGACAYAGAFAVLT